MRESCGAKHTSSLVLSFGDPINASAFDALGVLKTSLSNPEKWDQDPQHNKMRAKVVRVAFRDNKSVKIAL